MSRRSLLVVAIVLMASPLHAQGASDRARQIAVDFSKKKDEVKRKRFLTVRKYKEVSSTPWLAASPREYAGRYDWMDDPATTLTVAFDASGRPSAAGRDFRGAFVLRDAQITGALLTGVKLYADGRRLPFEAAFLQRSDRDDPSAPFHTSRGVAYRDDPPIDAGVTGPMRYFLARAP